MTENRDQKKESNVGMGIIYGLVLGMIFGLIAFPDNFIYGIVIGMPLGILWGAIMDMIQNRKIKDQQK